MLFSMLVASTYIPTSSLQGFKGTLTISSHFDTSLLTDTKVTSVTVLFVSYLEKLEKTNVMELFPLCFFLGGLWLQVLYLSLSPFQVNFCKLEVHFNLLCMIVQFSEPSLRDCPFPIDCS